MPKGETRVGVKSELHGGESRVESNTASSEIRIRVESEFYWGEHRVKYKYGLG